MVHLSSSSNNKTMGARLSKVVGKRSAESEERSEDELKLFIFDLSLMHSLFYSFPSGTMTQY